MAMRSCGPSGGLFRHATRHVVSVVPGGPCPLVRQHRQHPRAAAAVTRGLASDSSDAGGSGAGSGGDGRSDGYQHQSPGSPGVVPALANSDTLSAIEMQYPGLNPTRVNGGTLVTEDMLLISGEMDPRHCKATCIVLTFTEQYGAMVSRYKDSFETFFQADDAYLLVRHHCGQLRKAYGVNRAMVKEAEADLGEAERCMGAARQELAKGPG